MGLMQATEFSGEGRAPAPELAQAVRIAALKRNMIVLTCGPYGHIIRMIPPLIITEAEVDRAIEAWDASLAEVLR
jgi:4-aminobutyrate aminotransferase